jgi:translation initiation factor IF-1
MREIKFRVWDSTPTYELMTASVTLQDIEHGFNVAGKHRAVMQYTGLKDKNGVEIYEGDIVRFHLTPFDTDRTEQVHFHMGRFMFGSLFADRAQRWEVIGNIYENPELMRN